MVDSSTDGARVRKSSPGQYQTSFRLNNRGQPWYYHRLSNKSAARLPQRFRNMNPYRVSLHARLAIALSVVLLAACATTGGSARHAELTPEQRARADSAQWPYTQADVDFMTGMIGHHAQAIVMSRLAPTHDASPSIRILAERIINAQVDEIALMQMWLRDRGRVPPDPLDTAQAHTGHHGSHAMMPGMLTQEQLADLDAARGKEFDKLFLRYMIMHHQGAVTMVKDLLAVPGAAQDETTFKLASDINADQQTEIARMQQMLFALLNEKSP